MTASFPEYDWKTEGRLKDYWNYETLNDGLAGTVTRTLHLAHEVYGEQRYHDAMVRFGEFLILRTITGAAAGLGSAVQSSAAAYLGSSV